MLFVQLLTLVSLAHAQGQPSGIQSITEEQTRIESAEIARAGVQLGKDIVTEMLQSQKNEKDVALFSFGLRMWAFYEKVSPEITHTDGGTPFYFANPKKQIYKIFINLNQYPTYRKEVQLEKFRQDVAFGLAARVFGIPEAEVERGVSRIQMKYTLPRVQFENASVPIHSREHRSLVYIGSENKLVELTAMEANQEAEAIAKAGIEQAKIAIARYHKGHESLKNFADQMIRLFEEHKPRIVHQEEISEPVYVADPCTKEMLIYVNLYQYNTAYQTDHFRKQMAFELAIRALEFMAIERW